MQTETHTLNRDCPATIVPSGEEITIPNGTEVFITHRLGGNFTVQWDMGMARISGSNADALGEEVQSPARSASSTSLSHQGPPDEEAIWKELKSVFDPEIPINIVDLGLVYSMKIIDPDENGEYEIQVNMTLTAPGCGMGPAIAEDARSRVEQVPGVSRAHVELVWDPPWHQEMISEIGKMELGLI